MSETIEVYFKNENDAESAQAQLRTLKINHMYLDEMPEDSDTTIFVPFFSTSVDTNTAGAARGPVAPIISDVRGDNSGPNYPSYLLFVEVETEDYDQAMSVLQEHDCYMRDDG